MPSFAERYGYRAARSVIQSRSMDGALRNALWDAIRLTLFNYIDTSMFAIRHDSEPAVLLTLKIWNQYFKKPTDEIPRNWAQVAEKLREYFMACEWYDAYSFLEFLVKAADYAQSKALKDMAQGFMKREMAA